MSDLSFLPSQTDWLSWTADQSVSFYTDHSLDFAQFISEMHTRSTLMWRSYTLDEYTAGHEQSMFMADPLSIEQPYYPSTERQAFIDALRGADITDTYIDNMPGGQQVYKADLVSAEYSRLFLTRTFPDRNDQIRYLQGILFLREVFTHEPGLVERAWAVPHMLRSALGARHSKNPLYKLDDISTTPDLAYRLGTLRRTLFTSPVQSLTVLRDIIMPATKGQADNSPLRYTVLKTDNTGSKRTLRLRESLTTRRPWRMDPSSGAFSTINITRSPLRDLSVAQNSLSKDILMRLLLKEPWEGQPLPYEAERSLVALNDMLVRRYMSCAFAPPGRSPHVNVWGADKTDSGPPVAIRMRAMFKELRDILRGPGGLDRQAADTGAQFIDSLCSTSLQECVVKPQFKRAWEMIRQGSLDMPYAELENPWTEHTRKYMLDQNTLSDWTEALSNAMVCAIPVARKLPPRPCPPTLTRKQRARLAEIKGEPQ